MLWPAPWSGRLAALWARDDAPRWFAEASLADPDSDQWTTDVAASESCELSQTEFANERENSSSHLRFWIYRPSKE